MPYLKKTIFLIFLALSMHNYAQQISVEAQLDTNVMLIGDQVKLRINLQATDKQAILWPIITDTLPDKIEVVKRSEIDTTQLSNGLLNFQQTLTLTTFDSGYYVIQPIRFFYGDDYQSSIETEPHLLNVFTVEIDTAQAIRPIKGPIQAPLTWEEILPWALLSAFVLLLIFALVYYFKKKKKKQPLVFKKAKPKIPAHQKALADLQKVKDEKLWQQDQIKAYYTRVTDIIREYIEGSYKIPAIEMTTWEIVRSFAGARIEKSNLEALRKMLELADLVKFAKLHPMPDEHEAIMEDATNFVKRTTVSIRDRENINGTKETISTPEKTIV